MAIKGRIYGMEDAEKHCKSLGRSHKIIKMNGYNGVWFVAAPKMLEGYYFVFTEDRRVPNGKLLCKRYWECPTWLQNIVETWA